MPSPGEPKDSHAVRPGGSQIAKQPNSKTFPPPARNGTLWVMGNSVEYYDSELVQHVIFTPEEQIVLNTINQQVIGKETLADILEFLFHATQDVCPCDRLAMALVEEGTDRIVADEVRAGYDGILLPTGYAADLAGSSLQRVLTDDQVRLIPDLAAYASEHPNSRATTIMLKEGIRSSVACPVRVNDKNVGVLFRSSTQTGAYDNQTVGMHMAVTDRISRAVERAYNAAKATEAHNSYMEMLGFVTHELKSPVSSIIMDADMLVNGTWANSMTSKSSGSGEWSAAGNTS